MPATIFTESYETDGNGTRYTTGRFNVGTVSGRDEDVFGFTPTSTGSTTAGTFDNDLFFDGSAARFTGDIGAIDLSIG